MKYSEFESIEHVAQHYPLRSIKQRFLPDYVIDVPDWFQERLNFALEKQGDVESELYFREYIISRFIEEAWILHPNLKLWVNRKLEYKDELTGEPDYFLASLIKKASHDPVGRPLLAVSEAKRENFTKGWGQCLAAMIACQKLNDDENITIYGIVCTGDTWQFGKLEQELLTRHPLSYSVSQPERIFGMLDYVFGECEKLAV